MLIKTLSFKILIIFKCISWPLFILAHSAEKEILTNRQKTIPAITIVVHGTTRMANFLSFFPLAHHRAARNLKTPEGFLPAKALNSGYRFYQLAEALSQAEPIHFPLDHFFFFGWSGELSPSARLNAGKEIYKHIKDLKKQPLYKDSAITVITHSHGGNVLLSMASIINHTSLKEDHNLIDRFILLACPVQDTTEKHRENPVFKEVFTIHTTHDLFQVIDPQGLYDESATTLFSRRVFAPAKNLKQVCVTYKKRSLSHISFIQSWFWQLLPRVITLQNNPVDTQDLKNSQKTNPTLDLCPLKKITLNKCT